MNINSSRNSLLRSRTLRSARRSRVGQILSSRTSTRASRTKSTSTQRTTSSSLASSQSKNKQLALYEKVENSANTIQKNVSKMFAIGKMTYTDDETGNKAQENDRENMIKYINDFVSDFNNVQSNLVDIGGTSNLGYARALNSIVKTNSSALKEIGITVSSSGELSIDDKKLEAADFDKIKELFAKAGGFADKISSNMDVIEDTASKTVTALNKLYGATSTYNKYGTSNNSYNSSYNNYYNGDYYNNNSNWYF